MWTGTIATARSRATAFLAATASVERKVDDLWVEVAAALPCAVENQNAGSNLPGEPINRQITETLAWKVSFAYGADVRTGDRIQVAGGDGEQAFPVMIVGKQIAESMAVLAQVIATAEDSAVERYTITLERWNDATESNDVSGPYTIQAVLQWGSNSTTVEENGGEAAIRTGTMFFGTTEDVQAGDWIMGLPWGYGRVTAVFQPVGSRRDVQFRLTTGA
jgi:hypothetical protein